ncbi:hypothetical protein EVAR_78464_1 [Eumeta japonica]|uniref:Uncharacterized protein n=1 Tax=Eumeta variegata TaxID=151549 RepID=A0A4C1TY70_EUMVA|nr:hypothetical protein EVAR_78464_1 [Eumeta japonica]
MPLTLLRDTGLTFRRLREERYTCSSKNEIRRGRQGVASVDFVLSDPGSYVGEVCVGDHIHWFAHFSFLYEQWSRLRQRSAKLEHLNVQY